MVRQCGISHQHHQFLCTGHRRIEQIPVQQLIRTGIKRDHNRRILAALGLMDGDGKRMLQFISHIIGITCLPPIVKTDLQHLFKLIDTPDPAHVSVKDADPFLFQIVRLLRG